MKVAACTKSAGRTVLAHYWQDQLLYCLDSPFVGRGLFAQIYQVLRAQDAIYELERFEFLSGKITIA